MEDVFPYTIFRSNVLWWVDATIGIESKWDHTELNTDSSGNTAYGWGQMIQAYPITAAKRWKNSIDRWNGERLTGVWDVPTDPSLWSQFLIYFNLDDLYEDGALLLPDYVKHIIKLGNIKSTKDHTKLIDSLSYDKICALIITYAGESLNTDEFGWRFMASSDLDEVRDGAKKLYEWGHHSVGKGFTSTTPHLKTIKINMSAFYACPQYPSNALSAGTNQSSNVPVPANACTISGGLSAAQKTADFILSKFDIKSVEEYANDMFEEGWMVHDVTADIPTDMSKLVLSSMYHDPGVEMHKVFRIFNLRSANSQYVLHTNDAAKAKSILRANIIRDIENGANPDELYKAAAVVFTDKVPLYLCGILIYHRENWSMSSVVLPKEARETIKSYERVSIGDVQLFQVQFLSSTTTTDMRCVYYGPDKVKLAQAYGRGDKFKTASGVEWPVLNDGFIQSLNDWDLDPVYTAVMSKINKTRLPYYKDYLDQGNLSRFMTLGSYHPSRDTVNMSLMNSQIAITLFHEVGGHRVHANNGLGWGGGEDVLFTTAELTAMVEAMKYARNTEVDALYLYWSNLDVFTSAADDQKAFEDYQKLRKAVYVNAYSKNLMTLASDVYTADVWEDEFMARVYGLMAMHKCITFENDIYPQLQDVGVTLRLPLIRDIDRIMRDELLLDQRVYTTTAAVIPLSKRDKLKSHIKSFIESQILDDSLVLEAFVKLTTGTTTYANPDVATRALENFIEDSVNALPEDAYILNSPEFYLPIKSDNPQVILASSIGSGDGISEGVMSAFYGSILGRPVLAINLSNEPSEILAQLIHEYGHHLVYNGDMGIPSVSHGKLIYYLKDFLRFDWNNWSNIDTDSYPIYLMTYGKIANSTSLNPLGAITKANYSTDSELINETLVRIRANVAMESKFETFDDIFEPDKQTQIFTQRLINIIKRFSWP
jgi:hypothetical protein